MSYLHRVCMATGVAVANGHTDQGIKLKSGLRSLQHGRKIFTSSSTTSMTGVDPAELRPIFGFLNSDVGGVLAKGGGDDGRNQTDESLRHVMYMNCWGPS